MRIAISLGIVIFVSIALGYAFHSFLGFIETFILATFLQLLAPTIWNTISKHRQTIAQLEGEINYLVELNTAVVDCPCGNHQFEEIIVITDNTIELTCPACKGVYKLLPSVKAILTTEPLDIEEDIKIGTEI